MLCELMLVLNRKILRFYTKSVACAIVLRLFTLKKIFMIKKVYCTI